jgi:hypothetical protein
MSREGEGVWCAYKCIYFGWSLDCGGFGLAGGVLGGEGGVPVESCGWFLSVSCVLGCGWPGGVLRWGLEKMCNFYNDNSFRCTYL